MRHCYKTLWPGLPSGSVERVRALYFFDEGCSKQRDAWRRWVVVGQNCASDQPASKTTKRLIKANDQRSNPNGKDKSRGHTYAGKLLFVFPLLSWSDFSRARGEQNFLSSKPWGPSTTHPKHDFADIRSRNATRPTVLRTGPTMTGVVVTHEETHPVTKRLPPNFANPLPWDDPKFCF